MKTIHATLVALSLTAAPAPAYTQEPNGAFGSPVRFTETTGAATYHSVCAGCHMSNALGASGAATYPALANDPRLAAPGYSIAVVLKGQKAMPGFARFLTDQQVAEVVTYIRQNFGNAFIEPITHEAVQALR